MKHDLSRRDFLKIAGLSIGALAFRPYYGNSSDLDDGEMIRISTTNVSVYTQPWDESAILYQRYRDELVHVYYEVISDHGPSYNPLWYRVWGGYIHSAHTQRVETRLNPVLASVRETGQVGEITVPYTQAMRYIAKNKWEPIYRLYFESIHWITGVDQGPDGEPWYKLHDELLQSDYFIPAVHIRPIADEEMSPIHPDVDPNDKRIVVSLSRQELAAFEGDKIVFQTKISSGTKDRRIDKTQITTETPIGEFHIQNKLPSKHMGDGRATSDTEAYELPGVPWTCFFEPKTGVALHGTYWHTNWGVQMSHGCVNLRTPDALWVYRWTNPITDPTKVNNIAMGTKVIVKNGDF